MTIAELHKNFKIELDKSSNSGYPAFLPEEVDYWLNSAIMRFVKTRTSGLNVHKAGFQSNQKRTDDLKGLIKTKKYDALTYLTVEKAYSIEYPSDYMHLVGEAVYCISNDQCWPKTETGTPIPQRSDIIEATIENIDSKLSNKLSDHRLNRGSVKPIRLQSDNLIYLYTDGNYSIEKYLMTYIKTPNKIDSYSVSKGDFNPATSYIKGDVVKFDSRYMLCVNPHLGAFDSLNFSRIKDISKVNTEEVVEFLGSTMDEIVVLAVRLALENISEQRYQSYAQESQLAE